MIKAENITKSFGNLQVLKGINLEVEQGKIHSVVGASGAGKTTLLQILGTLSKPDSGNVMYNGRNISDFSDAELSQFRNRQIGFVFQFHHLLPEFTALENVCIPAFIARKPKAEAEKRGVKLTMLAFLIKASVNALKAYPNFNASLSADGDALILKNYYNIGFACDTPDGLVVPVVRDVHQKDVLDIARDLMELSAKARERKLKVEEMQGGCFTISSLGGIGGTMFTPIINCPEVAILGVSRSSMQPVYNKDTNGFAPRLILPMSLSYDHRVIDGADGARFTSHMRMMLSDVRRLLL